jgi:hypothetical protein
MFSLSTIANDRSVEEMIGSIEQEKNIRCELIKKPFSTCLGTGPASVCWYSKIYVCDGAEMLKVTLKVRDFYNQRTLKRDTVVTKISY